jgi:hypothetical protein
MHREYFMRIQIPCTAAALALAVSAPAAHAETIVTRHIVSQPVETVRTVTVTRTVRPIIRKHVVVTRRAVTERVAPVVPAPAAVATRYPRPIYDAVVAPPPVPAPYPRPVYNVVAPAPAPVVTAYPQPVYDVAAPAPAVAAPVVAPVADVVDETDLGPGAPVPPEVVGPPMPTYHYVYEPDRILVIDDATGIAVQALPR